MAASFSVGTGIVSFVPGAPRPDGLHTVTVDYSDNAGNAGTQLSWSFSQDTAGPAVAIQSLTPGIYFNSLFFNFDYAWGYETITAQANDSPSGVSRVAFYRDGILRDTSYFNSATNLWNSATVQNAPLPQSSWNTATVLDGVHSLFLVAFDTINNQSVSLTRTPYIINGVPVVTIFSPTSSLPRRPGQTVDVVFNSTDPTQQSAVVELQDSLGTVWGQQVLDPISVVAGVSQPMTVTVQIYGSVPDGTTLFSLVTVVNAAGQSGSSAPGFGALVDFSLPTATLPSPIGLQGLAQPLISAKLADTLSGVLAFVAGLAGVGLITPLFNI